MVTHVLLVHWRNCDLRVCSAAGASDYSAHHTMRQIHAASYCVAGSKDIVRVVRFAQITKIIGKTLHEGQILFLTGIKFHTKPSIQQGSNQDYRKLLKIAISLLMSFIAFNTNSQLRYAVVVGLYI